MYQCKKSTDGWFPVILVDETDLKTPETGKVFGDVTVKYHAEAAVAQETYSVATADWKEAGEGQYWLRIGAAEFTTEGKRQVSVVVAGCATYRFVVDVLDKTDAEVVDAVDASSPASLLATTVDGVALSVILEKLHSVSSGKVRKDYPAKGQTTYYKRDGTTVLFVMYDDYNEREQKV